MKKIKTMAIIAVILITTAFIFAIINSARFNEANNKLIVYEEKDADAEFITSISEDIVLLSKTLYGEARGVPSKTHQAAVVWCILNRVDSNEFPNTIEEVVKQPYQFAGYSEEHPDEYELHQLVVDVVLRWHHEKCGETNVGRILPSDYLYFRGDRSENYFSNDWSYLSEIPREYLSIAKGLWEWALPSPYQD